MATIVNNAETIAAPVAAPSRWDRAWTAVEARLAALVERANPILVKETRQALKSRQFIVTFLIVLAACWIISFAGVAIIGPQIYYAAAGPEMLMAYFAVLAFPLAVIVPYSAFRSLAAEVEDNTFDLLSITTLTSQQIITGKLWSAVVQMIVYLSAVSPCIAFTILLRGVDVFATAFLLLVAVLGCIGLSMLSLFVGASARVKHAQVVTSVSLVLALFGAFASSLSMAGAVIYAGIPREGSFWVAMFVLATIFVTSCGLLRAAAAAQIAFPSENRSTPLRWWMMAQQACFVGGLAGMTYALAGWEGANAVVVLGAIMAAAYWFVMGALMTAEWPHLSRRVQRRLPQSTLARTFLSFFNPGPASGYMFAVANLTALIVAALAVTWTNDANRMGWTAFTNVGPALVLVWSYVVGYLGLGRLVIGMLRPWMYVSLTAGFLFQVIIVLAGVGIPLTVQMSARTLRNQGYTLVQVTNPFWTIEELLDHGPASIQAPIVLLVVPGFALAMLIANMRSVAEELRRHRIAAPVRVVQEEAALHPPPTPGPQNPWEADDSATGGVTT